MACDPVDALLHDQFGFLTWNEHSRTDLQIEITERRMTGDMLQRLASGASFHHAAKFAERGFDGVVRVLFHGFHGWFRGIGRVDSSDTGMLGRLFGA